MLVTVDDRYFRCKVIHVQHSSFPKRQILCSSKLKEFADDKFKFDKNGRKLSKWVEKCSLRAISPFPTVFSKAVCC